MKKILLKNAKIVNENNTFDADLLICNDTIDTISSEISAKDHYQIIDLGGDLLLPGMIDDQVHFREPGLEYKGCIASESRAAVAGGITSYMEMPNVSPATTTRIALNHKHDIAAQNSLANYSFYLGATPDNLEQIKACDPRLVCGVKVFMGASTGDLLVEHPQALEAIFRECPTLIATHCEKGDIISQNLARLTSQNLTIQHHPQIRDVEACYASSSYAVDLAKKYNSDLHVLHITTAKELALFTPGPIETKKITAEACVHHLWFNQSDYDRLGNLIKCNPAIKSEHDRLALLNAINEDRIDIIATDHAPHTWQEKQAAYSDAPAGLPLVEHALLSLLDQVRRGVISIEKMVEKISHNPAKRYKIHQRGFIREGYFADLVAISTSASERVTHKNNNYLCAWSPFVDHQFSHSIRYTFVNGQCVYDHGVILEHHNNAMPLMFNR
ncbi:dihydroorotase [Pseudoalteromonas aurantia]|uniref:Dihydroorotase n=1 Tax=Pseudoalteromonas aurantia TaxID=43654 RepID=A0A5S3VEV6_9GAMM|nr:dihydroorotase [Pseudoalteromonas aurantia]TMO59339.1 dihydroorotase [Pseudoalteromonas aurantia]TMO70580.1 dihydroorotase [Pseudoalteromonas aurantia]